MPDLAKLIRVTPEKHLEIDGEEFPWIVSTRGVQTSISGDEPPSVTIEILAERVELLDYEPVRETDPQVFVPGRQ